MPQYLQDDYVCIEVYGDFELRGRFLPDLQDRPARSFHILAINEGEGYFLERATVPELPVLTLKMDDIEEKLKSFTVRAAKQRIDSGEYEWQGNYHHKLPGL